MTRPPSETAFSEVNNPLFLGHVTKDVYPRGSLWPPRAAPEFKREEMHHEM